MEIATTLLEYGASTNTVTRQGITPLHLAAQEGNVDIVTLLLARDAPINVGNKVLQLLVNPQTICLCVACLTSKMTVFVQRAAVFLGFQYETSAYVVCILYKVFFCSLMFYIVVNFCFLVVDQYQVSARLTMTFFVSLCKYLTVQSDSAPPGGPGG